MGAGGAAILPNVRVNGILALAVALAIAPATGCVFYLQTCVNGVLALAVALALAPATGCVFDVRGNGVLALAPATGCVLYLQTYMGMGY